MLTDGDIYQFIQWSSTQPILLLFAFDTIREFRSIEFDLKCFPKCTLKINVGIFEFVTKPEFWTNRFRSIRISQQDEQQNSTITHLLLAISKLKGQFVVIQINTDQQIGISEVTFNQNNDFSSEHDHYIFPSNAYIETNLHRLESLATKSLSDPHFSKFNRMKFLFMLLLLLFFFVSSREITEYSYSCFDRLRFIDGIFIDFMFVYSSTQ